MVRGVLKDSFLNSGNEIGGSGVERGWSLTLATASDLPTVLPLVFGFYRHFEFPWNEARKRQVLSEILASPQVGRLWLVRDSGGAVGYALVIYFLSLEFDGRVAVLDEFYLEPRSRGKGLGGWVLRQLREQVAEEGIGVIRLEVDERHPEAAALYARNRFQREPREVWSRRTGVDSGER